MHQALHFPRSHVGQLADYRNAIFADTFWLDPEQLWGDLPPWVLVLCLGKMLRTVFRNIKPNLNAADVS